MVRRPNISRQTQLVLQTLSAAPAEWWYGYDLSKKTGLKSGTLYPMLIRLHDQGYLEAEWREPDRPGRPPRHVYRLSQAGIVLADEQRTAPSIPVTASVKAGSPA